MRTPHHKNTAHYFFYTIFLLFSISGLNAHAVEEVLHYEFWPKPVKPGQITHNSYQFPEVAITLVNEFKQPAFIEESIYTSLSKRININDHAFISQTYQRGSWDIAFSSLPDANNLPYTDFFVNAIKQCLRTLEDKETALKFSLFIIDPEKSLSSSETMEKIIAEYKPIADTLFKHYTQADSRCNTAVNDYEMGQFVELRLHTMFRSLLTAQPKTNFSQKDLRLSALVFEKLLFSSQGLWVRNALKVVQPALSSFIDSLIDWESLDILYRDYQTYYDFIRLTLSDNHYLDDYSLHAITSRCAYMNTMTQHFQLSSCMPESILEVIKIRFNNQYGWVIK